MRGHRQKGFGPKCSTEWKSLKAMFMLLTGVCTCGWLDTGYCLIVHKSKSATGAAICHRYYQPLLSKCKYHVEGWTGRSMYCVGN